MPSDKYTNVRTSGVGVVQLVSRVRKSVPYISRGSQGGVMPLTPKERRVRQLRHQGRTADSGGFSIDNISGANTAMSGASSFFSPQLSTDFLELPQSLREKREIYRHFYNTDPIVGQAIDLHTELPMSKVRLAAPKPTSHPPEFKDAESYGRYILSFFEKMCKRIKLFQTLITAVHHYWLDGTCVPGDEWVTTDFGVKYAEDVVEGDLVLTHLGRWRPVVAVTQLNASEIIHLDIARLPGELRLTPNHPVETLRGNVPEFVPTSDIQSGDYVRITWPTEILDVQCKNLMEELPAYVHPVDNGYVVVREQINTRTKAAARAREVILTWLSGLQSPTMRSREDLAKEAGVPLYTIHNVILTLQNELPFQFKLRVPTGVKSDSHTMWLPLPAETAIGRCSTYSMYRRWHFTDAITEVPIDADLLYLLGYWLGDGTLSRDSTRNTAWGRGAWSVFGADSSLPYLERVEAALVRLFGRRAVVRSVQRCDTEPLHVLQIVGNPAFVEWWARNFGETSHGLNPKRVPPWVLTLPHEKQLSLLAGLIDSDGCVTGTHVGGVTIGVTSLNIASAARDLMLRLGAVPAMYEADHVGEITLIHGRWARTNYPCYTVVVHREDEAKRLVSKSCKASKLDGVTRFFRDINSYLVCDGNLYFKVRGVRRESGGPVFNFQVAEDATFRARFVSTHNCFLFAEDSEVQVPDEVGYRRQFIQKSVLTESGEATEQPEDQWVEKDNREEEEIKHYQKHYQGWSRLLIFPIDQVKVETFSFTDKMRVELIPSDRDRALIEQAKQGDPVAEEMVGEMPAEVREHIENGRLIPLGTDPDEGSFVYCLAGRKSAGDELGQSILDRCIRCHIPGTPVLIQRDGVVQNVPFETLDPQTDRVLSGAGFWRGFEITSRGIDEVISFLHMGGLPPIGCTKTHKYQVLRGGALVETVAGDIRVGDFLRVARIPAGSCINLVDLASVLAGSIEHEGRDYSPVLGVSEAHYTGLVYSLNVHEDHTFYSANMETHNCLYYREKLRQAQTQIASRAMTPKRIVWAEDISEIDLDDLREQVDLALVDPDYSIVANYEVHWEEMGSKDRLLDLSSEYEITDKQLHAGLGVTESLLSGETLYSGDRLKLEVINTRYLFLREMLQEYVEEYLFKPVARRKGFIEKDEWGDDVVLYPSLSFTRLPLRDSQDTYDALFNLYQKGSISIDLILEMFNIDPHDTRVKLEKDMFTVNDATFNETLRGIYSGVAQKIVDGTDVTEKITKYLKLKTTEEPAPEGRF